MYVKRLRLRLAPGLIAHYNTIGTRIQFWLCMYQPPDQHLLSIHYGSHPRLLELGSATLDGIQGDLDPPSCSGWCLAPGRMSGRGGMGRI